MRKSLHLTALIFVLALVLVAGQILQRLPADSQPYVEKRYAGWNGVLRGWICAEWSCSGSFVRWLNACAAMFERSHEGVYLEFTEVSGAVLGTMGESGIRLPELVFFSPGWTPENGLLVQIDVPAELDPELADCGGGRAIPVAMGGYAWVYNRALCDGAPRAVPEAGALTLLPDDAGRCFSAAAVALLSGDPGMAEQEPALPDAGLDLGLPASAAVEPSAELSEDALNAFINGEIAATIVTQLELARLIRLQDAGRGPDWACAAAGSYACADQLLMLGAVHQEDAEGKQREALAAEFAAFLCSEACQAKLTDIGAFPTTQIAAYAARSPYAILEAQLRGGMLCVSKIFSEHSGADGGAILRDFLNGNIDPATALRNLGLEGSCYEAPT